MIILYDMEEKEAAPAATMFTEKGWTNVFMLSGGLKAFAEKHPFYVEGRLPTPPPSPLATKSASSPPRACHALLALVRASRGRWFPI